MTSKILTAVGCGIVAATFSGAASATVGTASFRPVGFPAVTCSFKTSSSSTQTMLQPIPSNISYALGGTAGGTQRALSSYPVYLIFMGPEWMQNGQPTAAYTQLNQGIHAVLSSTYLIGTRQYGSVGQAFLQGTWIDTCTDPATYCNGPGTPGTPGATVKPGHCAFSPGGDVPVAMEVQRAISSSTGDSCLNPNHFAWAGATGTGTNASDSAIYVVIHYWDQAPDGGIQMSNSTAELHDNEGFAHYVNVIDAYINRFPGNLDVDTTLISHELVERMSTGTGPSGQCSPFSSQIGDGEPEVAPYDAFLNTNPPTLVQSYWSVTDQAYIVPDANIPNGNADGSQGDADPRVMITHLWNPQSQQVSLRQGNLSMIFPRARPPAATNVLIDTQVRDYAIDASGAGETGGNLYDLTAGGQVKQFTGTASSPSWTALTGSNTHATQVVAPRTADPCGNPDSNGSFRGGVLGKGLYMLASNAGPSGPQQVWQHDSGTSWTALTGSNTQVHDHGLVAITSATCGFNKIDPQPTTQQTDVYMWAQNPGDVPFVWHYDGSPMHWSKITGPGTQIGGFGAVGGNLYMRASNGGNYQAWQYSGSGTNWFPLTPATWQVADIRVAGDVLFIEADIGQGGQILEFVPNRPGVTPDPSACAPMTRACNWTVVTATNTPLVSPLVVQDGIELFMLADAGPGAQVWEFEGIGPQVDSRFGWNALTQPSKFQVFDLDLSSSDILQMFASQNGGPHRFFNYQGTPSFWQ
jgi:hypothetical protein